MPTPLEQSLMAKFDAAKNVFAVGWKGDVADWLKANAVDHAVSIELAQEALDAAWRQAKQDPSSVPVFDATLQTWQDAHVSALREFEARSSQ